MFVKVKGVFVKGTVKQDKLEEIANIDRHGIDVCLNVNKVVSLTEYFLSAETKFNVALFSQDYGLVVKSDDAQKIEAAMAVCSDAIRSQTMGLMQYRAEMREMQIAMYKAKIELEMWKRTSGADADAHCMLAAKVKAGYATPLLVAYTDAYAEYQQAVMHLNYLNQWETSSPSFEERAAWESLQLPTRRELTMRMGVALEQCQHLKEEWENELAQKGQAEIKEAWQEYLDSTGQATEGITPDTAS
ncbi:MAG: hypothetical protein BWY07_02002 [Candidatus Hydrogenedentes bacterium ADurb.Bin170]|nr:MAG: hypothetical protein BWY07_02002 [Candidatus Hydrogenedentes bacterium ADurb.Bin170]